MKTLASKTKRTTALPKIASAAACAALAASLVAGSVPATLAYAATSSADDEAALLAAQDGSAQALVSVALGEPDGEPEGGDYNKYNFYSGLPWCGHFVVWCARQAGVSADVIPDLYNCETMVAYYQQRGQWHDAAYIPEPGDLIFYSYGWGIGHVGIVTSVEGGYVHTKEGNTNNTWCGQVGSFARPVGTSDTGGWGTIAGYASPAFPDALETHLFTDTFKGTWYVDQEYLDYVVETGLMSGYSDGSGRFGPDDTVTRGQAATILYRIATGNTADTTNNNITTPFSDVGRGSYAAAAVTWAYDAGVATGYDDGQGGRVFYPDSAITREDLATMIARTASACGLTVAPDVETAFSQVQGEQNLNSWAVEPMAWCVENGIIGGSTVTNPPDLFPQNTAKRCEMTKMATVFARDVL